MQYNTVITGTGCYIPSVIKTNQDFIEQTFYGEDAQKIETPGEEIVEKFQEIMGIEERRYADESMNSSDMAVIAARLAIEDSGVDPEQLDQLIVAHNFGGVPAHTIQTDVLPALASRVKHALGIMVDPSAVREGKYSILSVLIPGPSDTGLKCTGFLMALEANRALSTNFLAAFILPGLIGLLFR